ncbi:hypothetical protein AMS68_004444 [Peltaster fructicola]|uniref:Uncharacterized protein n=1 Tax=Peltaster fructicola TaxID=286661 RepID=A0A6H0XVY9_9PEZI|nr:hypothetical protein AMS68_004444 [Peltaster fructicola]
MIVRSALAIGLSLLTTTTAQGVIEGSSFGHAGNLAPDGQKIPGWLLSTTEHDPRILSDRVSLTTIYPANTKGALWAESNINADQWTAELEFRASGGDFGTGNVQLCYRNLGRPSKLRVSNRNGLSVHVDDKLCFSSEQITIPSNYRFGITAVTAENPDIIEVFKFTALGGAIYGADGQQQQREQRTEQHHSQGSLPNAPEALPDRSADEINSNDAQFADLHNRLQSLQHQLAEIHTQFGVLSSKLDEKTGDITRRLPNIPDHAVNDLNTRVINIERIALQIQRDVEGRDYKQHFSELNEAMANVRGGLSPESLGKIVTASAPRMGLFLFAVIAVQVVLAGAYVLYKRRRANAPKKYL